MTMMRCFLCIWLVFLGVGCRGALQPPTLPAEHLEGVPKQLLTRQVIVTLAPASPEQWTRMAQTLTQTYGLPQVGAFPLSSIGVQCVVLQLPENAVMADIIRQLARHPMVESVQPNQFFQGLATVHNDPYATLQHGAQTVRADRVHHLVTGKGVKVAVIDTGVDVEHPDLHGRVVKTANFVDGGEQSFTQDSHGTAVAGIIAARADNDIGIFGIAPEAEILAVKACWQRTAIVQQAVCSSWTLAKAIDFAMLAEARILNFSLAGPSDALVTRLLTKAAERGITVIAATLEEEQGPGFPASLDTVIAVFSSDLQGRVHLETVVPPASLLAAPGVDILTTTPQRSYDFLSGSSLAAAHVTGIAALLLEQNSTLSPNQLSALLQATSRPVPGSDGTSQRTVGIIDACNALRTLLPMQTCD
jgi:subtilisin family serine protease